MLYIEISLRAAIICSSVLRVVVDRNHWFSVSHTVPFLRGYARCFIPRNLSHFRCRLSNLHLKKNQTMTLSPCESIICPVLCTTLCKRQRCGKRKKWKLKKLLKQIASCWWSIWRQSAEAPPKYTLQLTMLPSSASQQHTQRTFNYTHFFFILTSPPPIQFHPILEGSFILSHKIPFTKHIHTQQQQRKHGRGS